jgi:hypothetical protein
LNDSQTVPNNVGLTIHTASGKEVDTVLSSVDLKVSDPQSTSLQS